jgi:2-polyprenyl-3-methyl-5-hydroxy-6-metoxy-1,4-benzoquinol methylase
MEEGWLLEQFFRFGEEKMRTVSSEVYTKEYYLGSCRGFEEFLKGGISERLLYAFLLADLKKGMHVLDVGSGRGEVVTFCAKAGAWAKGIDYSQDALEIAKKSLKRVDRKVAKRILFERMNVKKISYHDKSFDVVFMIDVVEHLYPEELKQAFLEIKRVLKPDGKVIIHTPNAWLIEMIHFFAKIFFKWEEHKGHVNEQSFFSLRRELRFFGGGERIHFRPRKECFSEIARSVKSLPSWTIRLADFFDKLWENKVLSFLIYSTPLAFFLGTDLWVVVELPKEDKLLR